MLRSLLRTCCLLAALTACTSPIVTPLILPTLTSAPVPATVGLAQAASATPQVASATPQPSPTVPPVPSQTRVPLPTLQLAPTPAPTDIPQPVAGGAAIQINSPGPSSKIVSEVRTWGYALPGYNDMARAELYGEDGTLLAWQDLTLVTSVRYAYFFWELPFTINSAGELGRLSMSTRDQYGRLTALSSVRLMLFPEGYSQVYPPGTLKERVVIDLPLGGQRITGGVLTVAGKIRPCNGMPISVELVARDGSVVGSQLVPVTPSPDDAYLPFRLDVPYAVTGPTDALLTISQSDDRIGGLMYVFSQSVFINP